MADTRTNTKVREKKIPPESLIKTKEQLNMLSVRSSERSKIISETAKFYGVSKDKIYRCLKDLDHPNSNYRVDRGKPRKITEQDMKLYCEVIAAFKIRTLNKKGRHISTGRALEILEDFGVITPDGLIKTEKGILTKSTINRYLKKYGLNHSTLRRESPAPRFQADFSNDIWHFDLSPSDLKQLEKPPQWVELGQRNPTLMLYSVIDDRSGTAYLEYHCVYGEDTEAALRFLFNAMFPKSIEGYLFRGIPKIIYMDNGPISKSRIFLRVMACLGIKVMHHLPRDAAENKTASRGKGKVERPFRTVKDVYETLYNFHEPETEKEANKWLHNYLIKYNKGNHREEPHSRIEDWVKSHPATGIRDMCSWERFSTFAREQENRTVGLDTRISAYGDTYEVEPNLAGEEVTLWWGMFDNQLFVEFNDKKYGPYNPVGKLAAFNSFRKFKKTETEKTVDRINALAKQLDLPRMVLEGNQDLKFSDSVNEFIDVSDSVPFSDPDPFQEFTYLNLVDAKRAIAEHLGQPITKLLPDQRQFIDELLAETLSKKIIMERIHCYFQPMQSFISTETLIEEKENYVN
jgi:hypothetical protein